MSCVGSPTVREGKLATITCVRTESGSDRIKVTFD
jgi:hypothetical protein